MPIYTIYRAVWVTWVVHNKCNPYIHDYSSTYSKHVHLCLTHKFINMTCLWEALKIIKVIGYQLDPVIYMDRIEWYWEYSNLSQLNAGAHQSRGPTTFQPPLTLPKIWIGPGIRMVSFKDILIPSFTYFWYLHCIFSIDPWPWSQAISWVWLA